MKRVSKAFYNSPGWTVICEYRDAFNKHWLAAFPFYIWSYRVEKKNDEVKEPCNFDYNGECLICNCWYSDCAWVRYKNKDYRYESEEELNKMFSNSKTGLNDIDKI